MFRAGDSHNSATDQSIQFANPVGERGAALIGLFQNICKQNGMQLKASCEFRSRDDIDAEAAAFGFSIGRES